MDPLREDDPATLGPFTLRGRLGAGGMGVVYLAEDADGAEVAVKTVPRGVGSDVRVRLQREAELLATVDHPRIARFVDADADADEPWLAMRYIPGPSLADADLPLPRQQLRQLADGLAEALTALHRLGVTHRDVKPGNVIMTSIGAVLVDLGIAITADAASMTMAGTAVGSPAWMAPEQFAGDNAGPSADVWGWAAVLTYAATGREPFGSGTIAALAHRIMTQPADLRGVPDWLRGAVQLAFTKQPEDRPKAFDLIRGGRARVMSAPLRRPPAPPAGGVAAGERFGGPPSGPQRLPSAAPQQRPSGPPSSQRPQGPPSGPQPLSPTTAARTGAGRHGASQLTRRSRAWMAAAAVVVLAVVAVVLVITIGGGSNPAGDRSGTAPAPNANGITVALLKQDGLCDGGCVITGKVPFTHPRWGKVTLVTTQPQDDGDKLGAGDVAVIDSDGTSPWHYRVSPIKTFKPISDPTDSSGNIFMTYNAGAKDGVVVVGPISTGTGMDEYSSVPDGSSAADARFYDSTLSKVGGAYQIVVKQPGCTSSCTNTTYVWNTINYVVK